MREILYFLFSSDLQLNNPWNGFVRERALSELGLQETERRFKRITKIVGKFGKVYLNNLSEKKRKW